MRRDADIWDELQTLFHLAEATPELDRERVLAENCSDPELLRLSLIHIWNRGSWWDRCREGSKEELGGKILADVAAGRTFHDLVGSEAHNGHTWR